MECTFAACFKHLGITIPLAILGGFILHRWFLRHHWGFEHLWGDVFVAAFEVLAFTALVCGGLV